MKAVKIIKNVVIGALLVLFFVFAITMTIFMLNINEYGVTQLGDTTLIIINEEISSEKYEKGDLVLVGKRALNKINVGDEIFAYKVQKTGAPLVTVGKVGEIYEDMENVTFENGGTYSSKYVAGIADKIYSGLGTPLGVVQSKWGFLFTVLVPSFLIFIYELYAIVVEVKYGKEEKKA